MPIQAQDVLLEMRNICKSFSGTVALNDVSLTVFRAEVHVLLGENGAGKSTLMKILSGAYHRDAGQILIEGSPVRIRSPRDANDLGIRTIYQEFNLVSHLSIAENIFLGNEPRKLYSLVDFPRLYQDARALLESLGVDLDPYTLVHRLGIAEQQMVEVAKALSVEAQLLIMDEPTSALTSGELNSLFAVIRRLKKKGVGIIFISHRLQEIFEIGDRVTVLRDGNYVSTQRVRETSSDALVRLMVNRDFKEHFPRLETKPGAELLRVENLSRVPELRNINFSLREGEILGVAGLLGAKRTEMARAIFGIDRVDSGRILIRGKPAKIKSPVSAIRRGMGFLTEDRKAQGLVLSLSVKDNIALPNTTRVSHLGVISSTKKEQLAQFFIRELRIKTPNTRHKTMFLSGGNQQKVVLSKWLARETDILIFDEPTRGIDVGAKVEIYYFINQLKARGAGIIMISSELPEILGMSDRILVMHQGSITAEFKTREATQEKLLRAALG